MGRAPSGVRGQQKSAPWPSGRVLVYIKMGVDAMRWLAMNRGDGSALSFEAGGCGTSSGRLMSYLEAMALFRDCVH